MKSPITPLKAASVLLNTKGVGEREIGLTNEKAINQCIAHHGVIFQPAQRRLWLSTEPWQAGRMLCYELDELFAQEETFDRSMASEHLSIERDTAFLRSEYPRVMAHRALSKEIRQLLDAGQSVDPMLVDSLCRNNPDYYGVYLLAGDVAAASGEYQRACEAWQRALACEIPRLAEKEAIEQKLSEYGTR